MEALTIIGGKPLEGHIKAAGAKNAMTKLLVASIISDKKSTFYNVPNIGDVEITLDLCKEIGMEVNWDKEQKKLEVVTKDIKTTYIPQRFSGANRIPILMIGALLGKTSEEIKVPTLGGDSLGKRPLDFHIKALQNLGATIEYRKMKKEGAYFAYAPEGLTGAHICLPFPSVGATENTILAGITAKGTTIIENAAIEPEIIDLILFLQKIGADITVNADRTIFIRQARNFYEVEHTVISDRNEVASYAVAAISTKGRIFIEGAQHLNMIAFLNKLREVGGGFDIKNNGIEFFYDKPLKGNVHIETDVHPGFMTDWQQPFAVLLTQCTGTSVIHETVYEDRFGYTSTLKEMGADMELFTQCLGGKNCRFASNNHKHSLVVKGPTTLSGKEITIPDLRAGFAYVMAALLAKEPSVILKAHFLDRGYEDIVGKLTALGTKIKREKISSSSKDILKPLLDKVTV
jgi:UDP-N-acetylglucosamine 1-carboxyvinyltransferase